MEYRWVKCCEATTWRRVLLISSFRLRQRMKFKGILNFRRSRWRIKTGCIYLMIVSSPISETGSASGKGAPN